ncbi:unnamed protein product, partial [Ascophyllum nodosum]
MFSRWNGLPEGWEARKIQGTIVYINPTQKKTQWVRPVAPARPGSHQATTARSRAAAGNGPAGRTPVPDGRATTARSRAAAGNGPAGRTPVPDGSKANKQQLPRGWESVKTESGETYYVNHSEKITTWDPPTEPTVIAVRFNDNTESRNTAHAGSVSNTKSDGGSTRGGGNRYAVESRSIDDGKDRYVTPPLRQGRGVARTRYGGCCYGSNIDGSVLGGEPTSLSPARLTRKSIGASTTESRKTAYAGSVSSSKSNGGSIRGGGNRYAVKSRSIDDSKDRDVTPPLGQGRSVARTKYGGCCYGNKIDGSVLGGEPTSLSPARLTRKSIGASTTESRKTRHVSGTKSDGGSTRGGGNRYAVKSRSTDDGKDRDVTPSLGQESRKNRHVSGTKSDGGSTRGGGKRYSVKSRSIDDGKDRCVMPSLRQGWSVAREKYGGYCYWNKIDGSLQWGDEPTFLPPARLTSKSIGASTNESRNTAYASSVSSTTSDGGSTRGGGKRYAVERRSVDNGRDIYVTSSLGQGRGVARTRYGGCCYGNNI